MFLNSSPSLNKEWLAVGVVGNRWHVTISSVPPRLPAYAALFYFHLHCSSYHSTPCFSHTSVSSAYSKAFALVSCRKWAGRSHRSPSQTCCSPEDHAKQLGLFRASQHHKKHQIRPLPSHLKPASCQGLRQPVP